MRRSREQECNEVVSNEGGLQGATLVHEDPSGGGNVQWQLIWLYQSEPPRTLLKLSKYQAKLPSTLPRQRTVQRVKQLCKIPIKMICVEERVRVQDRKWYTLYANYL